MPESGVPDYRVIDPVEAVRARPRMYVGYTDARGVQQTFIEVSDKAIEEALAGNCDRIDVVLHNDGSLSVLDNGLGIGTRIVEGAGRPEVELAFTRFWPRGEHRRSGRIRVDGGMHGVGLYVVNALSEWIRVQVRKSGQGYGIEFSRGEPTKPLHTIESCIPGPHGTLVHWRPDRQVFGDSRFDPGWICDRLRELAYLIPTLSLTFTLGDHRPPRHQQFNYPDGCAAYVRDLNQERTPLHPAITFHNERNGIRVDGAFQYCEGEGSVLKTYANIVPTRRGVHESAFFTGLTRALNVCQRSFGSEGGRAEPLRRKNSERGLTAAVSVMMPNPVFESAYNDCLASMDVFGPVVECVYRAALSGLQADSHITRRILEHLYA